MQLSRIHAFFAASILLTPPWISAAAPKTFRVDQQQKEWDAAVVLPAILAELERLELLERALSALNIDQLAFQEGISRRRVLCVKVWQDFFSREGNHGKTLVALLKEKKSRSTREMLINELRTMYDPAGELLLAAIMRDDRDPMQVDCAGILIQHHTTKYGPEVVDRVADKKRSSSSRDNYLRLFWGPRYQGLAAKEKKKLICAGFALLGDNQDYFTACSVGNLVNVKFQPDQKDARYRDGLNLNKVFFDDTVRNALNWWAIHQKEYEPK